MGRREAPLSQGKQRLGAYLSKLGNFIEIKTIPAVSNDFEIRHLTNAGSMTDIVTRLLNACNAEKDKGSDFPTIWKNILKVHPYVAGSPIQDSGDDGPILKIPLITGQFLVFGSNFSLL